MKTVPTCFLALVIGFCSGAAQAADELRPLLNCVRAVGQVGTAAPRVLYSLPNGDIYFNPRNGAPFDGDPWRGGVTVVSTGNIYSFPFPNDLPQQVEVDEQRRMVQVRLDYPDLPRRTSDHLTLSSVRNVPAASWGSAPPIDGEARYTRVPGASLGAGHGGSVEFVTRELVRQLESAKAKADRLGSTDLTRADNKEMAKRYLEDMERAKNECRGSSVVAAKIEEMSAALASLNKKIPADPPPAAPGGMGNKGG